jgi:hypothetical protein
VNRPQQEFRIISQTELRTKQIYLAASEVLEARADLCASERGGGPWVSTKQKENTSLLHLLMIIRKSITYLGII